MLVVGTTHDKIDYIPAHIPSSVIYNPENYKLGDEQCKCQSGYLTNIDRHFGTWIYEHNSTKSDLIRHNRNEELKKFYQRNHFAQKQGIDWHSTRQYKDFVIS